MQLLGQPDPKLSRCQNQNILQLDQYFLLWFPQISQVTVELWIEQIVLKTF